MVLFMKAITRMVKKKGWASLSGRMVPLIKENSKAASNMETENKPLSMEISTKVTMKWGNLMAEAGMTGVMGVTMRASSRVDIVRVREYYLSRMVVSTKVNPFLT